MVLVMSSIPLRIGEKMKKTPQFTGRHYEMGSVHNALCWELPLWKKKRLRS